MASTIASTTATPPMIVYWRRRYAVAPSCTAREMRCISSFPGERASSQREVTTPYTTAAPAQTSAMITPQSVRKSKRVCPPCESVGGRRLVVNDRVFQRRGAGVVRLRSDLRHRPEQERAQSIEVLAENREGGLCGDRLDVRHRLQARVVVGHERHVDVAETELAGQPALRVLGHVDHVPAVRREPARLRPGGE